MKTTKAFLAAALTAGMLFSTLAVRAQYQQGPPPPPPPPEAYDQQPGGPGGPGGWEVPPPEYQDEIHQRAFHDGIEGARKDFGIVGPEPPVMLVVAAEKEEPLKYWLCVNVTPLNV